MKDGHAPHPGHAGRSARRRSERLREQRLARAASRSGTARFLRLVLGPSENEKRLIAQEQQWATGAEGERILAQRLARLCPHVIILHDRSLPRSRANIDHLALAPSGIYVIDAKRYRGKVEVVRLRGQPHLRIAGRDRTKLVDGLDRQVEAVRAALDGDVPVHGCLCFIAPAGLLGDSGLPLLRTLKVRGHHLYYPRRLARRLNRAGPLDAPQLQALAERLASRFPQAWST
jgi:hypothetical protein